MFGIKEGYNIVSYDWKIYLCLDDTKHYYPYTTYKGIYRDRNFAGATLVTVLNCLFII